jgi:hypothetical protein
MRGSLDIAQGTDLVPREIYIFPSPVFKMKHIDSPSNRLAAVEL